MAGATVAGLVFHGSTYIGSFFLLLLSLYLSLFSSMGPWVCLVLMWAVS